MYGEMSWDVGPQEPWIVGSTSRDGTSPEQLISAHGVVYNAKNVKVVNSEEGNSRLKGRQVPVRLCLDKHEFGQLPPRWDARGDVRRLG